MTPKKIPFNYNINRMCAVDLVSIIHIDDYDTRFMELHLTDEGEPFAVDGSTVTARFVTVREKYLLSDNVPCEADGNTITIPIDAAAVQSMSCDIKIEVNIVNGEKILTLPFPLWIRVRGSILDDAEITPESKGTIPELLEKVKEELERVQGYVDEEQVKNIIDGVLSGVTTNIPTLLIDNTANQQYNPDGHLLWYYIDSDGTRHNLFDFTPYIGGTDNYNSLKNKPSINNVTLSGNKTAADLGLQPVLPVGSDNELVDAASSGVMKRSGYRVTTNENVIADRDSANSWVPNARAVAKKLSGITQIKIVSGAVDANGHIRFKDSDGNTFTTTGESVIGADGASITNVEISSGDLYITISDGSTTQLINVGRVRGENGVNGWNGAGYVAAEINSSGELVLTFQSAYAPGDSPYEKQVNLGRVVGAGGTNGKDGTNGADGFSPVATVTQTASGATVSITDKTGTTTANIVNGTNGKDGTNGTNGDGYSNATINSSGDLVLTKVLGTGATSTVNVGHVVGATGQQGPQGVPGQDYVLTPQDKADIANIVLGELPTTEGVLYGNTSN